MTNGFNPDDLDTVRDGLSGRFRVHRRIESGGQGHVYRAERTQTKDGEDTAELVALKVFRPQGDDERIQREIEALESIRHRSLAGIVEVGDLPINSASLSYIAYEYVEGDTLAEAINDNPLSLKELAETGRDVASAIREIWKKRIVHRDVKPSNIIVQRSRSQAVLVDLAYARHLGKTSITTYGKTYGTQGYMSPEQFLWAERELTCKSDVFSLAVSLLEAALGQHPTSRDQRRLANTPPNAEDVLPSAPDNMTALLNDMLAQRAPFRPSPDSIVQTMEDLANHLE